MKNEGTQPCKRCGESREIEGGTMPGAITCPECASVPAEPATRDSSTGTDEFGTPLNRTEFPVKAEPATPIASTEELTGCVRDVDGELIKLAEPATCPNCGEIHYRHPRVGFTKLNKGHDAKPERIAETELQGVCDDSTVLHTKRQCTGNANSRIAEEVVPQAEHVHHIFCNADRRKSIGCDMCICIVTYRKRMNELEAIEKAGATLSSEHSKLSQIPASMLDVRDLQARLDAANLRIVELMEQLGREGVATLSSETPQGKGVVHSHWACRICRSSDNTARFVPGGKAYKAYWQCCILGHTHPTKEAADSCIQQMLVNESEHKVGAASPAPASTPQADNRCAICAWPLAESPDKGCMRGNCSMRPHPKTFLDFERACKEYNYQFDPKYRGTAAAASTEKMSARECNHRKCIGPCGVLVPLKSVVGKWRFYFCENCGAYKQWLDGEGTLETTEWKTPAYCGAALPPNVDALRKALKNCVGSLKLLLQDELDAGTTDGIQSLQDDVRWAEEALAGAALSVTVPKNSDCTEWEQVSPQEAAHRVEVQCRYIAELKAEIAELKSKALPVAGFDEMTTRAHGAEKRLEDTEAELSALREKLARALQRFEVLAERGIIGAGAAVADLKGDGNG